MLRPFYLRILGLSLIVSVALALPARAQQTIAEARNQGVGATVTVEGTVTRAFGSFVRLQDESGPTGASAIVIRQTSGAFLEDVQDGTIQPGTQLRASGTLSAFYGLIQINEDDLDSYEIQGQGSVPAPQSVTIDEVTSNGEDYESELIRIDGLSFVSASGTFASEETYTVQSSTGATMDFRVQAGSETQLGGEPIPGGAFAFEGVLGQFHGETQSENEPDRGYQLIPIRPSDLAETQSFSFSRLFTNAQEGDGPVSVNVQAFNLQSDESVSATVQVGSASTATNGTDVTGFSSPQTLTFSGPNPPPQTLTFDITADDKTEGVERLEVVLETTDGAIAAPRQFTLWIRDDATAQGTIAAGQTGDALIDQLQQTYGNPPTLGYDIARDSMYAMIYNDEGTVEGFYSGFQVTVDPTQGDPSTLAGNQGINTEHIWPQSQGSGEEPARSNMHILAPARDAVNSARSNYAFGEIPDADTDEWFFEDQSQTQPPPSNLELWSELDDSPSDRDDWRFEPRHSVKGDVARAVFYFVTVYPNRANLQFYEVQKETLFDWHQQDPVDATEVRRNILKASYQGNKLNPFIVDPTLIDRAYFSGGGSPGGDVLTIAEARAQGSSSTVTVEGLVTRVSSDGAYLQDDTAGLFIFQDDGTFNQDLGGSIQAGTRLQVTGTLSFYNGLLELTDVPDSRYEALSQDNPLPSAPTLTLSEITSNGEEHESELVRVEDFVIDSGGRQTFQGGTNYAIQDASGTLTFRVPSGSALEGEPIPDRATFEGVLGQFNDAGFDADEPDEGYQLMGLRTEDLLDTITIPDAITLNVNRSFGNDLADASSYRLVALPGAIDRPLDSTLPSAAGADWQAYWDDGSDEDYLLKFDGSSTFNVRPGRGFWLISNSAWTVNGDVPTVDLDADLTTSIPLHDGWNIISNPLDRDVAWTAVDAANDASLQPIWRFDGSFQQASTFPTAARGEAVYFLNNQNLDALQIPYPQQQPSNGQAKKTHPTLTLTAQFGAGTSSTIRVGTHPEARPGLDPHDQVAPTARFETSRLRIRCTSCSHPRRQTLAHDVRPPTSDGYTYTLVLERDADQSVTLHADGIAAFPNRQLVLQNPSTGWTQDLRADSTIHLRLDPNSVALRLLMGTSSFVENERKATTPEAVTLHPNYPNPFSGRTTIEYALPDARPVRLAVYDALGRRVRVLVDRRQPAGQHQIRWDGTTSSGRQAASGIYLLRLKAGSVETTRKIVLIR